MAGILTGAALVTGAAFTSQAAIMYVDLSDIVVPADFNGVYLNVVTSATSNNSSALPTYDLNIYSGSAGLTFYHATFGNGYLSNNGTALALTAGTLVDASASYFYGAIQGTTSVRPAWNCWAFAS